MRFTPAAKHCGRGESHFRAMESPENVGERRGGKCGGSRAHPHRPCDGFRIGGFCRGRFHAARGGTRPPKVLKSPFPKAYSFPERILRGKISKSEGVSSGLRGPTAGCRPSLRGVAPCLRACFCRESVGQSTDRYGASCLGCCAGSSRSGVWGRVRAWLCTEYL